MVLIWRHFLHRTLYIYSVGWQDHRKLRIGKDVEGTGSGQRLRDWVKSWEISFSCCAWTFINRCSGPVSETRVLWRVLFSLQLELPKARTDLSRVLRCRMDVLFISMGTLRVTAFMSDGSGKWGLWLTRSPGRNICAVPNIEEHKSKLYLGSLFCVTLNMFLWFMSSEYLWSN
jgi:hypothetical protein